MKEEELQCKYDSRKSFGGKAVLIHNDELTITELKSYNTIVAHYVHVTNEVVVYGYYSSTTARHINEFLQFYGFDKMSKQEMIACEVKK